MLALRKQSSTCRAINQLLLGVFSKDGSVSDAVIVHMACLKCFETKYGVCPSVCPCPPLHAFDLSWPQGSGFPW